MMKTIFLSFLTIFTVSNSSVSEITAQRDLGHEVYQLFSNRCAKCHGPGHLEGAGFSSILDFAYLRDIGFQVIPGNPKDSRIQKLIDANTMPKGGPALTIDEKNLVREWILAGAADSTDPKDARPIQVVVPINDQTLSCRHETGDLTLTDLSWTELPKFSKLNTTDRFFSFSGVNDCGTLVQNMFKAAQFDGALGGVLLLVNENKRGRQELSPNPGKIICSDYEEETISLIFPFKDSFGQPIKFYWHGIQIIKELPDDECSN